MCQVIILFFIRNRLCFLPILPEPLLLQVLEWYLCSLFLFLTQWLTVSLILTTLPKLSWIPSNCITVVLIRYITSFIVKSSVQNMSWMKQFWLWCWHKNREAGWHHREIICKLNQLTSRSVFFPFSLVIFFYQHFPFFFPYWNVNERAILPMDYFLGCHKNNWQ